MPYVNSKSIPLLFIDEETFSELGCPQPTSVEINEVMARLQAHFLKDNTYKEVLEEAIRQIKAKRDLI